MAGIHQPAALGPLRRALREQASRLGLEVRSVELVPGPFGGSDVRVALVEVDGPSARSGETGQALLELIRAGLHEAGLRPVAGPDLDAW